MIVVNVKGDVLPRWTTTDETAATLCFEHGVVLLYGHPEFALQVTGPLAQFPLRRVAHASLVLLEALEVVLPPLSGTRDVRVTDLRVPGFRPRPEARLAVATMPISSAWGSVEGLKWLLNSALDAFLHTAILDEYTFVCQPYFRSYT
jgi:hypothetical protein